LRGTLINENGSTGTHQIDAKSNVLLGVKKKTWEIRKGTRK
jgi:hypothetical protein